MSTEANPRSTDDRSPAPVWAALAMIAGGLVQVGLWPIFTRLHGPTSFNEDKELLGGEAQLWGALMEGPSSLLIAAGLAGAYSLLVAPAGRAGRIGFWMALAGLVIPAVFSLAIRETVPPLLTPVLGTGLVVMAYSSRGVATMSVLQRFLLAALGTTQLFAFLWTLAVRPDLMDRIDGYRIYGVVANVLFGVGWIVLGLSLVALARRA
ncbi:MAG TPA: hypothetical protein VFU99_02975 [Gaiellaceae bacterium]|nr:hypothetical protein [Gaiellaceae bacterium]